MNKQEKIITYIFINTRIPYFENNMQSDPNDNKMIQYIISSRLSKRLKETQTKSQILIMTIFQLNKGKTKIIRVYLAKDKKPLTEIIDSNKIYSDIRVNETDKIILHRMD